MKKSQKEAILISYLKQKNTYQRLAEFMVRMIQDDAAAPKEHLHAIHYRVKNESRLIEKIAMLNGRAPAGEEFITEKNYQTRINDLLGIRIICLRLSDVEKIEEYLMFLHDEQILRFVTGPEQKHSFILPKVNGQSGPEVVSPRDSGYSSIHYGIRLGANSDAPPKLQELLVEVQLRTILEEAWSEIDHKFRYVHSRSGTILPDYIHSGFFHLSAFLQVAALQAEFLCHSAEACSQTTPPSADDNRTSSGDAAMQLPRNGREAARRKRAIAEIETVLKEMLTVQVTPRTLIYIEKRLGELPVDQSKSRTLKGLLLKKRLQEFKTVFQEICAAQPFINTKEHNIDVINLVNFVLSYELQGKHVALEGLRLVLLWRKDRR